MMQAFNVIQDRISRSKLAGEVIDRGYAEAGSRLTELKRLQETVLR